jgi:hypothetical protein
MFIANKGNTQTKIYHNNEYKMNNVQWDAKYDGKIADINLDINNDGNKKNVHMSLNNEDTLYSESRFKSFLIVLIDNGLIDHNSLNTLVKDSAIVIKVSFDKTRSNENLKLESIYYWDYSNFRFLVPFLPLFNEYHKRNQCVNKAIESCIKNNMDAVVICPSLNHFKLYKNPLTYP